MPDQRETLRENFEKSISPIAKALGLAQPDIAAITEEALLRSDAFLRSRAPVIAVTGITSTGKSSLINALFRRKKVQEGSTADTSKRIALIRFDSGLLIYDTPGAGGLEVLENITRAYLGLKPLEKDLDDHDLEPFLEIPTVDADTYNANTDEPKFFKKHGDFERPDLFLFVVNIQAGSVKRDDLRFFREVASIGQPVIVVINKIDDEDQATIQMSLSSVQEKLHRRAIPVSAKTGQNVRDLATTIAKQLPLECSSVLGKTVNQAFENSVRQLEIWRYSLATAVKTAGLVDQEGSIDNALEMVSYVLGLYAWIVNIKFTLSESRLKEAGISFSDLVRSVEDKLNQAQASGGSVALLTLAGSVTGITAAAAATIATAGLALPLISLAASFGALSGGSLAAVVGSINGFLKKKRILDTKAEAQHLQKFISTTSRLETAASVLALGRALCECCEILEQKGSTIDFPQVFTREYNRAFDELKQFSDRFSQKHLGNEEDLIREISASIF